MRELIADGAIHRNLEFKALLHDRLAAARTAKGVGAVDGGEWRQVDTYFSVPTGLLKLRQSAGREAQLIAYARNEKSGERWSAYRVAPIGDPSTVLQVLTASLGMRGTVEKQRRLFIWNGCRIHLDQVQCLGAFIEFEVVSRGNDTEDAERMGSLMGVFALSKDQGILASYADLLGL
jgi:adenylate cyclase class IV